MTNPRPDGRALDQLRPIQLIPDYTKWAEGSVLACFGDTKVLCNASFEPRVPPWMRDKGEGWVTAEYSMLPRATDQRTQREAVKGKLGGRTQEISRLIGRALRAAVDRKKLGECSFTLDCDVIQADGGTRTAAITGAWLALALAIERQRKKGAIGGQPIVRQVAAVSIGVFGREPRLDLAYEEDQKADTDLNLVMGSDEGIIEVQGTAEGTPFSRGELDLMLELGRRGIESLFAAQRQVLEASR